MRLRTPAAGRASGSAQTIVAAAIAAILVVSAAPVARAASPPPLEQLTVDSANPAAVTAATVLRAGSWYSIEASGTYLDAPGSATPNRAADPECATVPPNPVWEPNLWASWAIANGSSTDDDPLDLYVDGKQVDWQPAGGGNLPCDSKTHTYRIDVQPSADRTPSFKVFDPFWQFDNVGSLTVRIFASHEPVSGPNDVPVETVSLDSSNGSGADTLSPLVTGNRYRIVASGTYLWNKSVAGDGADAECTRTDSDPTWTVNRFAAQFPGEDQQDVYLNGGKLDWIPLADDGSGCNIEDHTYRILYEPASTARANFKVRATWNGFLSGTLTIRIFLVRGSPVPSAPSPPSDLPLPDGIVRTGRPAQGTPISTVLVDPGNPAGADTPVLAAGRNYLLEASGTYWDAWPNSSREADVECTRSDPDPLWQPNRYGATGAALGRSGVQDDPEDLYVDGAPVDWTPIGDGPFCDAASHTYQYLIEASETRAYNVRIFDPFFSADNFGTIPVKVFEVGEPVARADDVQIATVTVDSASESGTISPAPLVPGQTYRIVASGTYLWDQRTAGSEADSECSRTPSDATLSRDRFEGLIPGEDALDLYVGGKKQDWVPLTDDGAGCDSRDHLYRIMYTPSSAGAVAFAVKATFHGYMAGSLTVRIFQPKPKGVPAIEPPPVPEVGLPEILPMPRPAQGTPLATVTVNTWDPRGGDTPPLDKGVNYLLEASGTYLDALGASLSPDRESDAECTTFPPDTTWSPNRWGAWAVATAQTKATDDPQDLYVGGQAVDWQAVGSMPTCDSVTHTYQYVLTPIASGPVNLRIFDPFFYPDNAGTLTVKVFPAPEPASGSSDVLVASFPVDASSGSDTSIPMVGGRQYRIVASGSYLWDSRTPGNEADAECSRTSTDATWARSRFEGLPALPNDDLLDLYVGGRRRNWVPLENDGTGCSAAGDHAYRLLFTPDSNGLVGFKVKATFYGYMSGSLTVRIYTSAGLP